MKSKPTQSQFLISVHQPKLWIAGAIVALCIITFFIWSSYEYGRHAAGFNQSDYDQEIEILRQALDEQTAKKEVALRENARLSRGSDIQKDASSQVGDSLAACEDEVLKMREELTFYHNIVAPRQSKREIQVNKVAITPSENGVFNYKIVLIQAGKHDYTQRGYVELSFKVRNPDGSEAMLALPSVSIAKTTKRQKFGFKYFQNFEGGIRFPEGIEPLSIFISAFPKSPKVPKVKQEFIWGDLIAGGNVSNVGQKQVKISEN